MSLSVKSATQLLNKDKLLNPSLSTEPDLRLAPGEGAREALAFEDVGTQMFAEALPYEEATRPFTESCIESGRTTKHTAEQPAPESLVSPQPFAKAQPNDDEATQPQTRSQPPCAQPADSPFKLLEEEGHLKKATAPEWSTQLATQLAIQLCIQQKGLFNRGVNIQGIDNSTAG